MQTKNPDQSEAAAARPPKKLSAPRRSMKKRRKVRAPIVPSCSPVPSSTPPPDPQTVDFYTETGYAMPDDRAAAYRGLCEDVANGGRLHVALKKHGISWGAFATSLTYYKLLRDLWNDALSSREKFLQLVMEDAADERGIDGVDVPVVSNGVIVTYKKVYSDHLLCARLQRADLRKLAAGGTGGSGPTDGSGSIIVISHIPEPQLPPDVPDPEY